MYQQKPAKNCGYYPLLYVSKGVVVTDGLVFFILCPPCCSFKFFTPYQDIKDVGNRLTRPLAMILMHCIACIIQFMRILTILMASLMFLIFTTRMAMGEFSIDDWRHIPQTLARIFDVVKHLAIINVELLVALPLVLASIFTRSVITVFTLCSDYLNSTDSFKLDEEEIGDLAKRYARV